MSWRWQDLPFRIKTAILMSIMLGLVAATGFRYHWLVGEVRDLGIDSTTDVMRQGYEKELKNLVDIMALTLSSAVQEVDDTAQIYARFSGLVKQVRFFPDHSGYFFIYRQGGTVFVHAAQPHLEGRNLIDFKDSTGKQLIRELDQVARAGGGYVEYLWEKPSQGLKPKLSYARMIPGTTYWIGTGVYIDDIQHQKGIVTHRVHTLTSKVLTQFYLIVGLGIVILVLPLSWLLIRSIVKPVLTLTEVAEAYSLGHFGIPFPAMDRKDEVGKLAIAIQRLGTSIQLAMNRLNKRRAMTPVQYGPQNHSETVPSSWTVADELRKGDRKCPEIISDPELLQSAREIVTMFDHWKLAPDEQLEMLGLSNADNGLLSRIKRHKILPCSNGFTERIVQFRKIQEAMGSHSFKGGKKPARWMHAWIRNKNAFFENRSPLDIIRKEGVAGLTRVADTVCAVAKGHI